MVLLAAAICTKGGKALVSRQFVEMTRSRIEGLIAAFPKLIGTGKQHTFVETESVRYVYQPMETLYMLLITTKNSNILEDLETLHLFAKVIPEYCRIVDEHEIAENVFELIFAFDEVISLGYRESVNLAQIRTFTDMDSHEEKIFNMVQKNKEREAKEDMKRKMKELEQQRRDSGRTGGRGGPTGFGGGGFGSGSYGSPNMGGMGGGMGSGMGGGMGSGMSYEAAPSMASQSWSSPAPAKPAAPQGKAMKLGSRVKTNDFVDALVAEGDIVVPPPSAASPAPASGGVKQAAPSSLPTVPTESIHFKVDEKIVLIANRDGGLQNMEVKGDLLLRISDPNMARIRIAVASNDEKQLTFKTHPNVDKKLWQDNSIVSLKDAARPFPVNSELGVLKWRFQTTDDAYIPLSLNCWPSVNNDGSCDVNIEYELEDEHLELRDVAVFIPLPPGSGTPVVGSLDGEHRYDARNSRMVWQLPLIDANNKSGSLEFSVNASDAGQFFPIQVSFASSKSFSEITVSGVQLLDGNKDAKFSTEVLFVPEKYEIV
eukprot:Colp12_sorted_trinity150504_noHs@6283